MTKHWYDTYANVVALARWLVEDQHFNVDELLDYLAKPWNWGIEWQQYQESKGNRP